MHLQRKGGYRHTKVGLNEKATLQTTEQQRPKPDRSSWKRGTLSGHCRHLGNICWDLLLLVGCSQTLTTPSLTLSDITYRNPRLRIMLAMFCPLSSCKYATSREPQKCHKAGAEMVVNLHLSWHVMWFLYFSLFLNHTHWAKLSKLLLSSAHGTAYP